MISLRKAMPVALLSALGLLASCQGGSIDSLMAVETRKDVDAWPGPQDGLLAPFKETAFRYRTPLEYSDGGRFLHVPYDELVDINKRDEIPVRKVRSWYVRRLPRDAETEGAYEVGGRKHLYRAVGRLSGGSKMTVIYIHGRGGNRDWGFDNERFGGNFNRLKNLLLNAGGAYVSPDFTDFESEGLADVKALIARFDRVTDGPLVVACGSLGNSHCWNLMQDANTASRLGGVIVLAGFPDDRFFASPAAQSSSRHVPLVISHGSWDPDYDYKPQLAFFRKLRKRLPAYPVRFVLFETGKHGAPVRMIDWRDTLNWIAAQ
ncbi:MAG: alpha/beta hydrolase [Pseudomonadota bacterium]|nr:alpha/beta hydrolase [Pseudomonadota bacterium]